MSTFTEPMRLHYHAFGKIEGEIIKSHGAPRSIAKGDMKAFAADAEGFESIAGGVMARDPEDQTDDYIMVEGCWGDCELGIYSARWPFFATMGEQQTCEVPAFGDLESEDRY